MSSIPNSQKYIFFSTPQERNLLSPRRVEKKQTAPQPLLGDWTGEEYAPATGTYSGCGSPFVPGASGKEYIDVPYAVHIITKQVVSLVNDQRKVLGSGHFLSPGLLVTANHVVSATGTFFFHSNRLWGPINELPCRVFPDSDVRLIRIPSDSPVDVGRISINPSISFDFSTTCFLIHAANNRPEIEVGEINMPPKGTAPFNSLTYTISGGPKTCGGVLVDNEGKLIAVHRSENKAVQDERIGALYTELIDKENTYLPSSWIEKAALSKRLDYVTYMNEKIHSPLFGETQEGARLQRRCSESLFNKLVNCAKKAELKNILKSINLEWSQRKCSLNMDDPFEEMFEWVLKDENIEKLPTLFTQSLSQLEYSRIDLQSKISDPSNGPEAYIANIQIQLGGKKWKCLLQTSSFAHLMIPNKMANDHLIAKGMQIALLLSMQLSSLEMSLEDMIDNLEEVTEKEKSKAKELFKDFKFFRISSGTKTSGNLVTATLSPQVKSPPTQTKKNKRPVKSK